MIIKVCGITEEENHLALGALPIDMVGINFYKPSSRFIDDRPLSILKNQQRVGVFVNASSDTIRKAMKEYKLDLAQLHGDESNEFCAEVSQFIPVIKVFRINEEFDWNLVEDFNQVKYFLFDTKSEKYGGTGRKFNWEYLKSYKGNIPFILSGGIGLKDADTIRQLNHPQFAGVDLNSLFEDSPGIKNISIVSKFIEEVKS